MNFKDFVCTFVGQKNFMGKLADWLLLDMRQHPNLTLNSVKSVRNRLVDMRAGYELYEAVNKAEGLFRMYQTKSANC